ncbi:MAG: HEAT repeat domain-containing protein [Deltaproteobacteria bacterium]|nr:HEAT repeat domain-containing protein [Deltaproteobacteria bacterium]
MDRGPLDFADVLRRLSSSEEEERRRALGELPEPIPPELADATLVELIRTMGDASWRVRKEAVARVARWSDLGTLIPRLIACLADGNNVGLRNSAIEALIAIGKPAVAPMLDALAGRGDEQKFIIEALAGIRDPRAVPSLARCLEDEDENVRAVAAEALGYIGGGEAELALRRRLTSADLIGRLAALESLNRLKAAISLEDLVPMLSQPVLRRAVLESIGYSGEMAALPYLVIGLNERVRGAREAAAVALLALHDSRSSEEDKRHIEGAVCNAAVEGTQGLISAVSAETPVVRRAAVVLLGWGQWPDALPRLVDALRDEEVRSLAARAIVALGARAVAPLVEIAQEAGGSLRAEIFDILPKLGPFVDGRVASLLVSALDDEDPDAASAAARALGDLGGKEAIPPLFAALEHDLDPGVPQAAAQALAKLARRYYDEVRLLIGARGLEKVGIGVFLCSILGSAGRDTDRPVLLGALKTGDVALRRAAAMALGKLGPASDAREALCYALADEDPAVRATAAQALGILGDRGAVPALVGAAGDDEALVRIAVVRTLGALGDNRAAPTLRTLARNEQGAIAMHAVESLGHLVGLGQEDEEIFLRVLAKPDPEIVKAAVRALGTREGEAAMSGLRQALDHPRWDVRQLAAHVLAVRAPHNPTAREALRARAREEKDPLVREALDAALAGA